MGTRHLMRSISGIKNNHKRGIVLLSGGIDSAVTLYLAKKYGYDDYSSTIDINSNVNRKEIYMVKSFVKLFGYIRALGTNTPVYNAKILIKDFHTYSKANGYYEFNFTYFGSLIISVIHNNYFTYSDTVQVNPGDTQIDFHLISK